MVENKPVAYPRRLSFPASQRLSNPGDVSLSRGAILARYGARDYSGCAAAPGVGFPPPG